MSETSKIRQTLQGKVTSCKKMKDTITVEVSRLVRHPLYEKAMRKSKKYLVHDPKGEVQNGDLVIIRSIPPMSARKSWELAEIVERAK